MAKEKHKSKFIKWPPPGSNEAVAQGCTCPVMDNHHGVGIVRSDGAVYWVDQTCKVHKKLVTE